MCLTSEALLQHLPSYLGFSYLGSWVSLHGCSSKAQLLLLTLDEEYLLTATPPDLERVIPSLGFLRRRSHCSLDVGLLLPTAAPGLGHGVVPVIHSCAVTAWHSWPLPLTSDVG